MPGSRGSSRGARLSLQPITLREANAFVQAHHRHHQPARGCVLTVAAATVLMATWPARERLPSRAGLVARVSDHLARVDGPAEAAATMRVLREEGRRG